MPPPGQTGRRFICNKFATLIVFFGAIAHFLAQNCTSVRSSITKPVNTKF